MDFAEWLMQATEDDKRVASDFRHHYPVEQTVWRDDDNFTEPHRIIVCGCDETMAHEYGVDGHRG